MNANAPASPARPLRTGRIVQVTGAVVDVEFARTDVPKIYVAL